MPEFKHQRKREPVPSSAPISAPIPSGESPSLSTTTFDAESDRGAEDGGARNPAKHLAPTLYSQREAAKTAAFPRQTVR